MVPIQNWLFFLSKNSLKDKSSVYNIDHDTLDDRLEANETILKEINNAHRTNNDTLDARLDDIDNAGDA